METSTLDSEMESKPKAKRPAWSLVRTPTKRYTANDDNPDVIKSTLDDDDDDYDGDDGNGDHGDIPTQLFHHSVAFRTSSRKSRDGQGIDSETPGEIQSNPWTTCRQALKSPPQLLDFHSDLASVDQLNLPSELGNLQRPKLSVDTLNSQTELGDIEKDGLPVAPLNTQPSDLDLSVISNFTPVGQIFTFRRIDIQPEVGCDSVIEDTETHVNAAFDPDISPINTPTQANSISQTERTHDNDILRTTPLDDDTNEEESLKHQFGINQKHLQSTTNEPGERSETSEMKVLSNSINMKDRWNGIVTSLKRSKRRSDTEQLDVKVRDSVTDVPDGEPPTDDDADKTTAGPFIYCRIITKYPKSMFLLTFAGHFLIAMTTIGLLLSGYDLFPTDFQTLPMSDWTVPWMKRDFAWRYRDQYHNRYVRKWFIQDQHKWYRSKDYARASIVLYYDTGKGNIFEKENLQQMKKIEDRIFSIEEYQKFCLQTTAMVCQKPTSILRLFDGTFVFLDGRFFDPGFNKIAQVLNAANTNNYTKSKFAFFLSKDSVISPTLAYSPMTRTVFPMGFPLQMGEHSEKMEDKMEGYLVKHFKPVINDLIDETSQFDLIYWSYLLFRHDIVIQIMYDCIFAVGSATFIFLFIVYHTKSLWISTLSVFSILTSFLATNIVYRAVLDYRYFGFFHVIAFFIILGIGVDDVFVFMDVWKSTGFKKYPSLAHRLSDAYRKSVLTMFFTSLTTSVAFFANVFSPLLAPQSFGTFAGLLVIVNYISVIVYFPTVLMIYHLYFKSWKWPCCTFLRKKYLTFFNKTPPDDCNPSVVFVDEATPTPEETNRRSLFHDNTSRSSTGHLYNVVGKLNDGFTADKDEEYGFCDIQRQTSNTISITSLTSLKNNEVITKPSVASSKTSIVLSAINNFDDDTTAANGVGVHVDDHNGDEARDEVSIKSETETNPTQTNINSTRHSKVKKRKALVIFFRDYYFRFVTHWLIRWIIVVVLTGVVVFFAYSITKLETENEQVQLYRKSHNYGRALDLDFHYFVANEADRNVIVYIVWGLKPRDMSVCHFSDGRCEGQEQYDEEFDPSTPQAQIALKKFCDRLHRFTAEELEYYSIRRDFVSKVPEIRCFTDELDGYLKEQSVVTGLNLSLPWTFSRMSKFMKSKGDTYNTDMLDKSFTETLQVPISYWLNDGYKFQDKSVFDEYQYLIGESISEYSTPLKSDMSVFVGNKIRYIGVQVNLTLGTFTSGYPVGKPAMDRWEKFVQTEMKQMPKGMQNGFQLTRFYWHSISVQKTMADNAITGIVIGILFAFPILTIATQNIVIAFFAIVCMCCSTICVIGVIPLAGWKLGILESLNMCMVVGLTVDFVVHLSEGYHISTHTDRRSRVQDMLELMGISIFSGACTTLGASLFMVFAQIQFIIRFGIFMFCTIGFSLLYSLGLFTTLMGILGPNGKTGDITTLYNGFKRVCWNKKSDTACREKT